MDSSDLTTDQAAAMRRSLMRYGDYLRRVLRRMEKVGFTVDDPLYQKVSKAYDAYHTLHIDLHYRSCGNGVSQDRRRS